MRVENPDLGIIYAEDRNGARLPAYHRLDVSLKKQFNLGPNSTFTLIASITNVYNRKNVFYFDRVNYERVDQLPILPSLGATLVF